MCTGKRVQADKADRKASSGEKEKNEHSLSKSRVTGFQWLGETGGHFSIQGHLGGLKMAEEGTCCLCSLVRTFAYFQEKSSGVGQFCFAQVGLLP